MSDEELLDFCTGTLQVLHLGMSEVYVEKLKMNHGEENSESQHLTPAILDRKNRIRHALIIYLAIAVSKLPARSQFWQKQQKPWLQTSSDIFKRNLQNLEAFDEEILNKTHNLQDLFWKEFLFLDAIEKGKRGLRFWEWDEPGPDDHRLSRKATQNVLKWPLSVRSELLRAVEECEYLLKPMLRKIKDKVKSVDGTIIQNTLAQEDQSQASASIQDISEAVEATEKHEQAVQQELREILRKRPRFEEIDSESRSAGEILSRAKTIIDDTLQKLVTLYVEISHFIQIRGIIEIQRRADLLPSLNSADEEFSQRIFADIREDFFSYLKALRRSSSFPEHDALTPEETILQQRLKKKVDSIIKLTQKEKYKWLRIFLGHWIIKGAVEQGIKYPVLHDLVKEFFDFFDIINELGEMIHVRP
ncbi:hypothetical protein L207DRAFT_508600 [Hyaloscypha variabilis F]|uniref:Uncharacterized protein n=1 Tax=Hyaloscypha variabilis (strain UAMH 11265 / GT02V1 / F) TaxID=1149755 RepID=A0A2J6S502_HYAVF|nr:hypothetical protein L207DRAFT_508600 [Hyaloscypha variabilis F]